MRKYLPSLNTKPMTKNKTEFLKSLIGKRTFTASEMAKLRLLTKEAGLTHSFNSGCMDCYRDAVILLCLHYGIRKAAVENPTPGKYSYLRDTNLTAYINGRMVTMGSDTPDELVEEFQRAIGGQFNQFYKLKKND